MFPKKNNLLRKLRTFSTITATSIVLSSCGNTLLPPSTPPIDSKVIKLTDSPKENPKKKQSNNDEQRNKHAIVYRAKYGVTYEILGNVIAKYPHFDLSIFNKALVPESEEQVITYELTSKDGFSKTHIASDPRRKDKQHFYLEGLHFYYHSNAINQINIYMPPQLLAGR